jgi:hypothetical protein
MLQAKFVPLSKHPDEVLKTSELMRYVKIAVCSEIDTKYINKAESYYRLSPYGAVSTPREGFKNESLMLYEERIAVCSEIHKKHVNKAESYYRLRLYRAENAVLSIYVS